MSQSDAAAGNERQRQRARLKHVNAYALARAVAQALLLARTHSFERVHRPHKTRQHLAASMRVRTCVCSR
eukprot:4561686-Pleurochrysis_carterae.AAC.2